jgi:hypothetical protein
MSDGFCPATRASSESISLLSCVEDLTEYSIISPKVFSLNFGIPRKTQNQSRSIAISRQPVPADRDSAAPQKSLWRLRHDTGVPNNLST